MTNDSMEQGGVSDTGTTSTSRGTSRRSLVKIFVLGLLVVVGIAGVVAGALAHRETKKLSAHPAVLGFAKTFGIKAATINGIAVPYGDYIEDLSLLKTYYETQPAEFRPTDEQISDQVISRLVVNALISDIAKRYNVTLTRDEAENSEFFTQLVAPLGGKEAAIKEIETRYGLSYEQYIEKVVMPVVLEQKLREAFEVSSDEAGKAYGEDQVRASHILFRVDNPDDDATVKKQAQDVLDRAKKGEDFTALAKEFGSDGTKDIGGDLGWFGREKMVQEFADAAFAGEANAIVPELVKTQFGYHIIKVDEKRTARSYEKFMGDQLRKAIIELKLPIHDPFVELQGQLNAEVDTTGAQQGSEQVQPQQ